MMISYLSLSGDHYGRKCKAIGRFASPQTFDSDWQTDSMLLFADQIHQLLKQDAKTGGQADITQALLELVEGFKTVVRAYYGKGISLLAQAGQHKYPPFTGIGLLGEEKRSYEHRRMIDLIADEWARLLSLVATARFFAFTGQPTDPALNKLTEVIRVAQQSLLIGNVQQNLNQTTTPRFVVLPHFGRHFELLKFDYAQHIFVVGVPVTSLYCPWDWTFIWHEIAGVFIQSEHVPGETELRDTSVAKSVASKLEELVADEPLWTSWNNRFNLDYLLEEGETRPSRVVLRNWAEELVEDSFSTLCLGEAIVPTLAAILERFYAQPPRSDSNPSAAAAPDIIVPIPEGDGDGQEDALSLEALEGIAIAIRGDRRHPPQELRVAVARCLTDQLLGRKAPEEVPGAEALATTILSRADDIVAKVITPEDTQTIDTLVEAISVATGPLAVETEQLGLLVAAAAKAFRSRRASGDRIRLAVYGRENSYFGSSAAPTDKQFDFDGLSTLEQFQEYRFSQLDQGTATATGEHSHNWLGVGVLELEISGVTTNGGVHGGTIRVKHKSDWHK